MTDQPIDSASFVEVTEAVTAPAPKTRVRRVTRPPVGTARMGSQEALAGEKKGLLASLDTPIVVMVGLLLAIGAMMVYSTTFDWAYQDFGSETAIVLQHVRNIAIGLVGMVALSLFDYRRWKKFAVILLIVTFALLVGVLLFGDNTFGARRAFFNGSYQPGELAELIIIIYMAAWLSAKSTRIRSVTGGLIPFVALVGAMAYLVLRQPDISTAAMIVVVAGIMFFLAGADLIQLGILAVVGGVVALGLLSSQDNFLYAQDRVESFISGTSSLTETNYHVQQAIIAFINGGWTGVGLGEGRQKFGFLPAPHTDSIFAVIGEELGVVGAGFVITLYVILIMRGFTIARRAPDLFGSLLASGVTIWIAAKALLNVAVMTAVLPATGAPLPLISFGGSSLVVMLGGVGLLLSVARVTARTHVPEWRAQGASHDLGGRDGRRSVPSAGRSRGAAKPSARR